MPESGDSVVRWIRKGQIATFESKGSLRKTPGPAPHDGLLIETNTATILLSRAELHRAVAEIDKHSRIVDDFTKGRDIDYSTYDDLNKTW